MRADLHTHTKYSHQGIFFYDGVDEPEKIVRAAKRAGLDAVAITDHDSMDAIPRARAEGKHLGVSVIPGCEITSRDGHILAYGIEEPVPPYLSAEETVERIHEQGGVAVAAHPFAAFGTALGFRVLDVPFDGVEIWNASLFDPLQNALAEKLAREANLPGIAGSDAHSAEMVGYGVTEIDADDVDDVPGAIKRGNVRVIRRSTIPLLVTARWLKRRAEMNREYAREYFRHSRKLLPLLPFYMFLLRLPRVFDFAYLPPAYLFLYLLRKLSKRKYRQLHEMLDRFFTQTF